jgi:hypothetical protein
MAPRAPRSQEIATERRRRSEGMDGYRDRLSVAGLDLDPAYEHRWVNDDDTGRIAALTQSDDYDPVRTEAGVVTRQVGVKPNNEPLMAVLVRKRRAFCEEDRAKKLKAANEPFRALQAARRGDQAGGGAMYVAADAQIGDD